MAQEWTCGLVGMSSSYMTSVPWPHAVHMWTTWWTVVWGEVVTSLSPSDSCILGELFTKRPLFPGYTEIGQLDLIR